MNEQLTSELTIVPADREAAYTELYRYPDGSFGAHVEDGEVGAEPHWTREEAERIFESLGHLLWPNQYDDPTNEDEDELDEEDEAEAAEGTWPQL